MNESIFSEVIVSLGGVTLVVGFLSRWLGEVQAKRIIQNEKLLLDKALEHEKSKLQLDVEIVKSTLLSRANIMESRLNTVNQERLGAISENYKLLADIWLYCRWAIQPDEIGREKPPAEQRLAEAAKALDDYFRDFERKKIFLSNKSQKEVYRFLASAWTALNKFRVFSESSQPSEEKFNTLYDAWIHDLKPQIDTARKSIEMEYKVLIGISDTDNAL